MIFKKIEYMTNFMYKNYSNRLLKAIFKTEGWSLPNIAQALKIHEASVTRFIRDYCNSNKLQSESGTLRKLFK